MPASLDSVLASIPGYGAYIAKRKYNEDQQMGQLQQMGAIGTVFGQLQSQADQARIKQILDEPTATPEQRVNALLRAGPSGAAAAHQYATALKELGTMKALEGLKGADLTNPDVLIRASMIPGMSHLGPEVARAEKTREEKAGMATMRSPSILPGTPIPGTNMATTAEIPPSEQAAFGRVAAEAAQGRTARAIATPGADEATTPGGLYSDLYDSPIAPIAREARRQQTLLNAGVGTVAQHETRKGQMVTQNAAMLERRANEPLQAIVGPDGKPVLVRRTQAEGQMPASGAELPPLTGGDLTSAGAQVANGMPISQVIPGYGRNISDRRESARREAISQIKAQNPDMTDQQAGQELANRQIDFVAGKRSVGQLTTMLGASRQAVDQLDFNVKKASEQMAKLPSSDLSPIINAIARGEQKWTGDPAYYALYFYMNAAAMESARLLQGGQASVAQLHQGAADEARKWASVNMTPKSWNEGVAPAMVAEGRARLKTYEDAIARQRLGGGNIAPSTMPEFATEADAAKANISPGTRVRIGGKTGVWR